jgi:hypothetical protein
MNVVDDAILFKSDTVEGLIFNEENEVSDRNPMIEGKISAISNKIAYEN